MDEYYLIDVTTKSVYVSENGVIPTNILHRSGMTFLQLEETHPLSISWIYPRKGELYSIARDELIERGLIQDILSETNPTQV